MFSQERQQKILALLHKEGRVLAKDLAQMFDVSVDSIRRDLSILEEARALKRTHGGAIPLPQVRKMPEPPSVRYGEGNEYQHAIAELAAGHIQENETVFIGGAAIHYVLLKYLPKHFPFTVVTNSIVIGHSLKEMEHIQTYLLGGKIKASGNITDALANDLASQFTIDLCFATGGGLSGKGLSTATPEVAIFNRTIMENSRKVIGLVGHNKFGVDSFVRMTSLNGLNIIITDEETPKEEIEKIEAEGIKVLVAKKK